MVSLAEGVLLFSQRRVRIDRGRERVLGRMGMVMMMMMIAVVG
jgi:hypothetical protein